MNDSPTIIVTGALGHIGSRLIRELPVVFPAAKIVMIDNLSTQRYPSLFDLPTAGKYTFVEADVLTADLERLFDKADVVIHLAAITDAAASVHLKEKVEHNNFTATQRVAETCLNTRSALIFPSSTSVYGTQKEAVDETCSDSELCPQSPYAETKLKEERLLAEWVQTHNLRCVICRFGTIFGTSPGMRFHTAVNKFCWQAVMQQPLTVWRTALHQKRPYLDLGDAVRAITFLIENELFDGRTHNVLTVNATVNQIIEQIRAHVPDLNIELVDCEIMNQLSYEVSNKRFCELGFDFQGCLAEGIAETIRKLGGRR